MSSSDTPILVAFLALVVALIALLRDTMENRRTRAAAIQGLVFQDGRSGVIRHINGDRGLRKFNPSVHAVGFGMRYDVRTYLWVNDLVELKWKGQRQTADRFDNTSDPLTCEIEIYDDDAHTVWFGIAYNETSVRGLFGSHHVRSQFVRSNLDSVEVQVWKWSQFSWLLKWWQRQTVFKFWGGGAPKPLGRWKRVSSDNTHRKQFPTWDGT